MATIAEKLQTLQNIKSDIKTSILNKGVEVGDDFTTYSIAIDSITTGGGGGTDTDVVSSSSVYPYFSPEQLKELYDFGFINSIGEYYYYDWVDDFCMTYKYDGLLAESPNNGEPLIENYYYDYDYGEWKYVTNIYGNNYVTPLNSVIEPALSSYSITNVDGKPISSIYNTIVTEYPSEVDIESIQGYNQPRIYYGNETYEINTYEIRDLVSGESIRYFHPMIVPSQAVGSAAYFDYFYDNNKGKTFDSLYIIGQPNNITKNENNPIICRYWLKYDINEVATIYTYENYPAVVAPVLEYGDLLLNNTFYLTHPIIKKAILGNVKGSDFLTFEKSFVDEVKITSIKNNNKLFYYCKNLKKINNINMGTSDSINISTFKGCYNLTDIGGLQDLGKSFQSNRSRDLSFSSCSKLTKQSLLNVFNSIYDMTLKTFGGANITLGKTNLQKLTDEDIAIATNKGWVVKE